MTVTTSATHRSRSRAAVITMRFAPEDRDEIKRRAAEAGMTMQDFIYTRVLDRPRPAPRRPGPATKQQEALPVPAP